MINIEELEKMASIMEKYNLNSISINEGAIVLKRNNNMHSTAQIQVPSHQAINEEPTQNTQPESQHHIIKSPLVGTIYTAPTPGARPFINVGDTVEVGDKLFIIEAMKTFHPVYSKYKGKVVAIYAVNDMPVEFDEILIEIKP